MRITSKTIDQRFWEGTKTMRSKPGLYFDYNSQICYFMSLFRHSEWFSFPVKQFPSQSLNMQHIAAYTDENLIGISKVKCFEVGGVRTGIAKHHGRCKKSDYLCQDGEEWKSRAKRLWRRIFVKCAVEISDLPLFSSRDVWKKKQQSLSNYRGKTVSFR